jgi:geranial dehydrogenase
MSVELGYDSFYIGGSWVRPSTGRVFAPVNASTEEPLGHADADIDAAVAAARQAFDEQGGWPTWEPAARAA